MPNNHTTLVSLFSDIANSIRSKTGGSTNIVADNFPNAINNIHNDATITSNSQLLSGVTAYGPNGKFTGNIPTVTHPNPTISTATFNTSSLNVEVQATHVQNSGIVVGGTTTATTNVSIASGTVTSSVTSHTVTTPTITVSHSGNIATIGTTTKPSGTAGTNYYQIGFSNSVTNGNTNARSYGNISVNGYVTTANNTASSWSNKAISATVTQPATYYINKGNLTASNISGASYLETTGDYGFRATVVVPEGYHAGETVVKNFTTGIFPAPESKGTANRMLTGYSLYDEDGKLITGSMPNQGAQNATISTQGGTYTIPEGYHNGNGVITALLSTGSATTPATTIYTGTSTLTVNQNNGYVTAPSVKASKSVTPTVVVGYVSQGTAGTITANFNASGLQLTTKTGDGSNYQNNLTITPAASDQTIMNRGEFLTANHIIVKAGSAGPKGALVATASAIAPKPSFSINAASGVVTATVANFSITARANVSTNGYVDTTNNKSASVTGTGNSNTYILPEAVIQDGNGICGINATEDTIYTYDATNSKYYGLAYGDGGFYIDNVVTTNGWVTNGGYIWTNLNNTTVTTYTNKASITTTVSGTIARNPVLRYGGVPSGTVNAAKGAIETTAPTSGVYITVNTPANTATATATISTVTAGYTDGTNHGATQGTKSGGAAAMANRYIPIKEGTINTPSGALTLNKPSMAFNATTGIVTGTVAATSGTVYRNITDAGWLNVDNTSGSFTITGNSNTINVGLSTLTAQANSVTVSGKTVTYNINAVTTAGYKSAETKWVNGTKSVADGVINLPSGSAAQSTPTFSINTTTGIVTASVAAKNGTAYRNITTAGYLANNTTGGNFQMTASSNTYNAIAGLGTATRTAGTQGFISAGSITNASNHAVNASDNIKLTTEANGRYRINVNAKATTTAGYIAAGTSYNTTGATYINKATASITNQTLTGTITGTAASATAGTASITFANITTQSTATNYKITYNTTGGSASANSGTITGGSKTAYANVTEGYTPSTIASAAIATVANVAAVTQSATGGSNNGIVYLKAATATNGSASGAATVSASGANASTTITGMETTTTNTGYIVSATANATSGAITALTKTATASVTDGYTNTGASATATATVNAVAAKTASNSNTQYIIKGSVSDYSAKYKKQSTPTFAYNATTGILTASVAQTTQAICRNVAKGYHAAANTTGLTFTMNASSNTYNVISSIPGELKHNETIDGNNAAVLDAGYVYSITALNVNGTNTFRLKSNPANGNIYINGFYPVKTNGFATTSMGMNFTLNNAWGEMLVKGIKVTTAVSGTISRAPVLRYGGVPSGTVNAAGGAIATTAPTSGPYITVNTPANTATATATVSSVTGGYTDGTVYAKTQGTKAGGAAAMANQYIPIKVGDVTYPEIDWTPGLTYSINYNNGYIAMSTGTKSNSVAPTSSNAGWIASMPNISFVGSQSSNSLQLVTKTGAGSNHQNNLYIAPYTNGTAQTVMNRGEMLVANHLIVNGVAAGTLAAGSAAVLNNSNGNIRYYRNVSAAGYLATNTTAYYLQLNTKAGGTTTVSAETTLVNAGQFVIGAIKAKPAAATYTIANFDLSCPLLTTA